MGYVAALSLKQEPIAAGEAATLEAMAPLPEPKRLARRASFVPAAATKRDAFPPEMRTIAIAVRDLPTSLRQQAGVAVYDAHDHEVAWLPLAAAKEQDGALHVTVPAPSEQKLRIVVASEFAGFAHGSDLVRGGSQKAYELGRQADRQDAEVIIMPGGNWPAMDIIEQLETELGKPVLTNNATSLWAGLRLLGIHDGLQGCGRLLRDHL